MATESIAKARDSAFFLPYDDVNRAGEWLEQARGIAACVGMAVDRGSEMPEGAATSACWAIKDILDRVEAITALKGEPQPEANP